MNDTSGKPLRLDPNARSASSELPAFLARPSDAPVYHGFPLVEESRIDDWIFGTITDYEDPGGCEFGDAFVVAPGGARAGLVWQTGDFEIDEIVPPDESRWGVYSVAFSKPVRSTADFVECCHKILPTLKRIYEKASRRLKKSD